MDKKDISNRKLILKKPKKVDNVVINVLIGFCFILSIFMIIIVLAGNVTFVNHGGNIVWTIIFDLVFVVFLGSISWILIKAKNNEIIIENSIVKKGSQRKTIGNINEITSYCETGLPFGMGGTKFRKVTVLKDTKEIFSFYRNGQEDTNILYDYIKSKCQRIIYFRARETGITLFMFFLILFMTLIWAIDEPKTINEIPILIIDIIFTFIIFFIGIDEFKKTFIIINDEIIYKRLFIDKKIPLKDLKCIKYQQYGFLGFYAIKGYNDSSKCFKMGMFDEENLELIKTIAEKHNIQCLG